MRFAIVFLAWLLPQVIARNVQKNITVEEDKEPMVAYVGGGWDTRSSPHDHGSKHYTSTSPNDYATFTFTGFKLSPLLACFHD
jgi:hypothetical protein